MERGRGSGTRSRSTRGHGAGARGGRGGRTRPIARQQPSDSRTPSLATEGGNKQNEKSESSGAGSVQLKPPPPWPRGRPAGPGRRGCSSGFGPAGSRSSRPRQSPARKRSVGEFSETFTAAREGAGEKLPRGRRESAVAEARYLTAKQIKAFSELDPKKLVQTLDNQLKSFTDMLERPSKQLQLSKPDDVETILQILSKLAQEAQNPASELQGAACKVLAEILSERCAVFHHHLRVTYIPTIRNECRVGRTTRAGTLAASKAKNLCQLFRILLSVLPSTSWSCLPVDELYDAVSTSSACQFTTAIVSEAEEIIKLRDEIKDSRHGQIRSENAKHDRHVGGWDNSEYRQQRILPSWKEICARGRPVQLRKNVVDSSNYEDWMHYYDVQFRLLREDFVAPLRKGIAAYQKGVRGRQLTDVNVYEKVAIIQPKCIMNGVCFEVQFDATKFARYNWEHSKRLIFGSLVCLSSDDFVDVILFGTVANSEPRGLSQGRLMLQIENPPSVLPHCKARTLFVMVESSVYFEACRHTLQSLQVAEVDTMPFTNYLIKGECANISPPRYLQVESVPPYNLSCLFRPETKSQKRLEINVLDESAWESMKENREIQLDQSQLNAIKMSLTKEISVIQGPPGTGKTYIGLKIVEALLTNRHVWDPPGNSPILVMCYTNHALDQFLEGILQMTIDTPSRLTHFNRPQLYSLQQPRIVRVGGRSQSEEVDKFNIKNVLRMHRPVPRDEYARICGLREQLSSPLPEALWRAMKSYFDPFRSNMSLLSLEKVRQLAHPDHYYQLYQMDVPKQQGDCHLEVWLGLWELVEPQHETQEQHLRTTAHKLYVPTAKGRTATAVRKPGEAVSKRESSSEHGSSEESTSSEEEGEEEGEDVNDTPKETPSNGAQCATEGANDGTQRDLELVQLEGEAAMEIAARVSSETLEDFNPIRCDEALVEKVLVGKQCSRQQESEGSDEEMQEEEGSDEEMQEEEGNLSTSTSSDESSSEDSRNSSKESEQANTGFRPARHAKAAKSTPRWKRLPNALKIIRRNIFRSAMNEYQASNVMDVNNLSLRDRWRLYNYWEKKSYNALERRSIQTFEEYEATSREYRRASQQSHRYALEEADVIGMTTTGAAKHQEVLHMVKPKIVIVEEAAEVLEAHIVSALNAGTQHLILIGDHKQLRPKPNDYELATKYNLEVSLFERLLRKRLQHETLQIQHRMRPEVARLVHPHIYDTLINHTSVEQYGDVKGVSKNMFFIHHELPEKQDLLSHANEHEADYIVALCRYLLQQGYKPTQITILTPYTGQLLVIRKRMPKNEFGSLRITAVDNFQGEENDIILLSLVRSNKEGIIGFLKEDNRVCVSLSRAKMGFYCIGNFSQLRFKSNLWERIMSDMEKLGYLGDALPLQCQNHPDVTFDARVPGDFKKYAPSGGCSHPCETRLPCGHVCVGTCHPTHENYTCKKRCERKCENDHAFPSHQCYKACPQCVVEIDKTMPECGHMQRMPCHMDPSTVQCYVPCSTICNQGQHQCKKLCYEECDVKCLEIVPKIIPKCGHKQTLHCHKDPQVFRCKFEVEKELPTCHHRHIMPCYKDPSNFSCGIIVEKELPQCHHKHTMRCSRDPMFFKCNLPCEKVCPMGHQCAKVCCEDCDPECMEMVPQVLPECGHEQLVPCHEDPKLVRCSTEVERELLQCKHKITMPCCEDSHSFLCPIEVEKELPQCRHKHLMPCHQNPSHFKCRLPCERKCPNDHPCTKLCYEKCNPCAVQVEKVIQKCRHKVSMPCHVSSKSSVCPEPCPKLLPCRRHKCPRACGESCPSKCIHKVDATLPCGHRKLLQCWRTEPSLVATEACTQRCERRLRCKHPCTELCGKPCTKKCAVEVRKPWPCGHTLTRKCYEAQSPTLYPCNRRCRKKLQCGHKCKEKCGEKCTAWCKVQVVHDNPCGHPDKTPCKENCVFELPCGHRCSGKCGECYTSRLHKPCLFQVQVERFCGHTAVLPCTGLSDSCDSSAYTACATAHEAVSWQCSGPRELCSSPCEWTCPHDAGRCSKLCHEMCERPPCNKQCEEFLRCGHKCASVCGEPCLQLCPSCDQKEFKVQLQGTSRKRKKKWVPEKNQLYIQLDCKHIFTVEFLDQYMHPKQTSDVAVAPKHCPTCRANIRSSYRYGNSVKESLRDIDNVREIVSRHELISEQAKQDLRAKLVSATAKASVPVPRYERRLVPRTYTSHYPQVRLFEQMLTRTTLSPEECCLAQCYLNSAYLADALHSQQLTEYFEYWKIFARKFADSTFFRGGGFVLSLQLLLDYKSEQHRAALTLQCSLIRSQPARCLSAAVLSSKARTTPESVLAATESYLQSLEQNRFLRISDKDYERFSQLLAQVDPGCQNLGGHPLLPIEDPPVVKGEWFKCREAGHYYCRPPRVRKYSCPSCSK